MKDSCRAFLLVLGSLLRRLDVKGSPLLIRRNSIGFIGLVDFVPFVFNGLLGRADSINFLL